MVFASERWGLSYLQYVLMFLSPTALWENVFLLILTAIIKFGLTAWTFGMMVLLFY